MQIQLDNFGNEIVIITYEDGSQTSMLKSTYDEMIAAQELNKPTL